MSGDEPIDWAYERDKEKAAVYRSAVLSDEETQSNLRAIDEKYDRLENQRRRKQAEIAAKGLREVTIHDVPKALKSDRDNQILATNARTDLNQAQKDKESSGIDREYEISLEKWRQTQSEGNVKWPISLPTSDATPENSSLPDLDGLSDFLTRNKLEQAATIRKAEEAQQAQIAAELDVKNKSTFDQSSMPLDQPLRAYEVHANGDTPEPEGSTPARTEPAQFTANIRVVDSGTESVSTADASKIPSNQEYSGPPVTRRTTERVVLAASDVQSDLPKVGTSLKLSIQSALTLLEPYTQLVRQSNQRVNDPDTHDKLLETLERIIVDLSYLLSAIPENVDSVSTKDAEKVASKYTQFKNGAVNRLKTIADAENLGDKTVSTAIILICGSIGGYFGNPFTGIAAGAYINGAKPDELSKKIFSKSKPDDDTNTPDQ